MGDLACPQLLPSLIFLSTPRFAFMLAQAQSQGVLKKGFAVSPSKRGGFATFNCQYQQ
jgi:hypothetical protein